MRLKTYKTQYDYWTDEVDRRIVADDYEPINPRELLQEQLNQFIGEPNTEITRAAIQSLLFRYNFLYGEHLTIEDLNMF